MFFNAIRDERALPGMPSQEDLIPSLNKMQKAGAKYPWATRDFTKHVILAGFTTPNGGTFQFETKISPTLEATLAELNRVLDALLDTLPVQ